ncbi:hypothetical protein HS088_TW11G00543 [Tripterygium wilfordii]|uniref:Uncharacterized protein n=1 Tax=Tripterygium wilfordii TaxID=458696 RepID=A0A7J7D2B5_TRIWF|nr:hypothetical protein HS088_TW11G00543 [Tripterygium wilfordii]
MEHLQETKMVSILFTWSCRNGNAVVYNYRHGISGFAARLSADEAHLIAQRPGVVSVFPDPIFSDYNSSSYASDDTIIGILDSGIWPDSDMTPIPSRWKGICMEGPDFNCNRKIIGARVYNDPQGPTTKSNSPRDEDGHGTHVAVTAAGRAVQSVSYHGLANGTAKGGSPGSRIAVYKVCSVFGCAGSSILAAFDDAIADGVDILSLLLGTIEFKIDAIAIGAFHAVANGMTVVCSAGNGGPSLGSVVNDAPWILTIATTTIDRDFESDVVMGDKTVIKGEAINFANIQKSPVYPLIYSKAAKKANANCYPDSLNKTLVEGRIVLCEYVDSSEVQSLGGVGVISVDDMTRSMADTYGTFPTTEQFKRCCQGLFIHQLNKPDISTPGVDILAAWNGNDTGPTPKGEPVFSIISGTSMSCPHISGVAATVKSKYPTWSPSMIRSAIMTTAFQTNNLKEPMTTHSGSIATPYDYGAGEVSISGPLNLGLVYETTTIDYLNFLCYYGYNESTIQIIASATAANFTCPQELSKDLTSNKYQLPINTSFKFIMKTNQEN